MEYLQLKKEVEEKIKQYNDPLFDDIMEDLKKLYLLEIEYNAIHRNNSNNTSDSNDSDTIC